MKEYVIDGAVFFTLEEFFAEISRVLLPGQEWGRNLDAFHDILRGGFGTPDEGFRLRWKNHQISRERLGHAAAAGQYEALLAVCHLEARPHLARGLARARAAQGPTLFDDLVTMIRAHGPGGEEQESRVELVLD